MGKCDLAVSLSWGEARATDRLVLSQETEKAGREIFGWGFRMQCRKDPEIRGLMFDRVEGGSVWLQTSQSRV